MISEYQGKLSQGVYINCPEPDYRSYDAVNWSRLKLAARSQAHYETGANISEVTRRNGVDLHAMTLEPERFAEQYVVEPNWSLKSGNCSRDGSRSNSKATAWCKARSKEFREANAGKEIVTGEWYHSTLRKIEWIRKNELARLLICGDGYSEVVAIWNDSSTGILCKCKADRLVQLDGKLVIADLKGTQDCSKFLAAIGKYQYHAQLAFYMDGMASALDREVSEGYLIPVEHDPPHLCMAAPISFAMAEEGRGIYEELLMIVAGWGTTITGYENPECFDFIADSDEEVVFNG